ncbi:DUF5689 domain-containing protein [Xanthomarina gelatinilytica]|uniref:DUF5689 domain-containing protein n=1 Tax=Xanthomarina gelatinilytica TaxID=1137281 RepID=UPI003AA7E144
MKKIYFLLLALIGFSSFAQSPIITSIVDGDCSGGNPKLLEIYANGAVDFSLYSLENQTNANTTWGNSQDLSSLGTVVDDFVYVTTSGSADAIISEFPSLASANILISNTMNLNGDDRIRIVLTSDSTVIDQYGVSDVDGSGESWEYADSYATRVNGTGPDGGFIEANWNYGGAGTLDGLGICQGGSDAFETLMGGIGVYTTTGSTEPTLNILTPGEGATLIPGTTSVNLSINVQNFNVGPTTGGFDGHIHWTINGNAQSMKYDTNDESISVADGQSYTIFMQLVDNAHAPISPAVNATVNFSVASATVVADLAALRADYVANGAGAYYQLSSTPTVTYTRSNRNQKYIQDVTAGILIDDAAGNISTTFAIGDGMSGLMGQASEFNGVLQLTPITDASVTTGTTVTPQVVTITDLLTGWETYESELVQINNTSFTDAGGTFATSTNYDITDPSTGTMVFRPFNEADYIGETIPSGTLPLVGLIAEFGGAPQISARSLNDLTLSTSAYELTDFSVYPNPTSTGYVNITSKTNDVINVAVFDILGKQVINNTVNNNRLDVSTLTTGVYIMKISQNGQVITKKLVVK